MIMNSHVHDYDDLIDQATKLNVQLRGNKLITGTRSEEK